MSYTMEELLTVVGKLAGKYTGFESTSITYEKARQLMEAVLYCINELEGKGAGLAAAQRLPAQQAYERGLMLAEEKVREALRLYNEMQPDFSCYGNRCLRDTFMKELPHFFQYYDVKYEPQNTMITLDYPVLKDLSGYRGIDRIYEYILCLKEEQAFLAGFPEDYVEGILSQYDKRYETMIENICGPVKSFFAAGSKDCIDL